MDTNQSVEDPVLIIEGVFYLNTDGHICSEDGVVLDDAMAPFEGRSVVATVHHLPPDPPTSGWGGGSCMWQPAGKCPAGHHDNPSWLHHVSVTGPLKRTADGWLVGGKSLQLELLDGHRSRVALVEVFNPEAFASESVSELLERGERLSQLLRDLTGKIGENR